LSIGQPLVYETGMTETDDWASQTEQAVLDAALPLIPRLGWSGRLMSAAGAKAGLSPADVELLLPHGPRDLAALYARRLDAAAILSLDATNAAGLKVRERIAAAVLAWMRAAMRDEAATRRWMGFLALAPNAPLGLRLAWASADAFWRWAGDTATDENHYTKRLLLAEILVTTLAIRLSSGAGAAEAHLESRISGVMTFERWKANLPRPAELADRAAAWLGRLRYGDPPLPNAGP
jgi:ubiquinone biosynthesis protein COQ9